MVRFLGGICIRMYEANSFALEYRAMDCVGLPGEFRQTPHLA